MNYYSKLRSARLLASQIFLDEAICDLRSSHPPEGSGGLAMMESLFLGMISVPHSDKVNSQAHQYSRG